MSQSQSTTKKVLNVYTVENYEVKGEKKSWWARIGRAHKNSDGSLNVYLAANPINGQLVIRSEEVKEKTREAGDDGWTP